MKIFSAVFASIVLLSVSQSGLAASKPSDLSLFNGKYTGTVNYGGIATGSATGVIKASKTKEKGVITLSSTLFAGGSTIPLLEQISINKKSATYTLQVFGQGGTGAGTVNVGKKKITYFATFSVSGQSYSVQGTITKNKKSLAVSEFISGNTSFPITYSLKGK